MSISFNQLVISRHWAAKGADRHPHPGAKCNKYDVGISRIKKADFAIFVAFALGILRLIEIPLYRPLESI
jgi:hypothetical protein